MNKFLYYVLIVVSCGIVAGVTEEAAGTKHFDIKLITKFSVAFTPS